METKLQRLAREKLKALNQKATEERSPRSSNALSKNTSPVKSSSTPGKVSPIRSSGSSVKPITSSVTTKTNNTKKANPSNSKVASSKTNVVSNKSNEPGVGDLVKQRMQQKNDIQELKRQAVIREREKRKKERDNEVLLGKNQSVHKIPEKPPASSLPGKSPIPSREAKSPQPERTPRDFGKFTMKLNKIPKEEVAKYRDEARKREMERERQRRKSLVENTDELEIQDYDKKTSPTSPKIKYSDNEALAVKKSSTKVSSPVPEAVRPIAKIDSKVRLQKQFLKMCDESGTIDFKQAKELLALSIFKADLSRLGATKRISWKDFDETMQTSNNPPKVKIVPTTPKPDVKVSPISVKTAMFEQLLNLCQSSFKSVAAYSRGVVRASDINAFHLGNDITILAKKLSNNQLPLPLMESSGDSPVSWNQYRTWLCDTLGITIPAQRDGALDGNRGDVNVPKKSPQFRVHKIAQSKSAWTAEAVPQSPNFSPDGTPGVGAIDRKIRELESRLLNATDYERQHHDLRTSDEESDIEGASPMKPVKATTIHDKSPNPSTPSSDEAKKNVLYAGRCWMFCEKRNENWLVNDDDSDPEWLRCPNVCVDVEVTQVRDPFRLYISATLMRSGISCTKRIGVDELATLSEYFARYSDTQNIKSIDLVRGMGAAGESWTKAQIQAAINAEKSMKQWIEAGEIPKQSELVIWVLMHSTIRITGDEDAGDAENHIDMLMPGDMFNKDPKKMLSDPIKPSSPSAKNMQRQNFVELKNPSKEMLVKILNNQRHDALEVSQWLACRSVKALVKFLSKSAESDLSVTNVTEIVQDLTSNRGNQGVTEILYGLVQQDILIDEFFKQNGNKRIADVFDIFQEYEPSTDEGFIEAVQQGLHLDIPEWQLVIWHHMFPRYRDFIQMVYKNA